MKRFLFLYLLSFLIYTDVLAQGERKFQLWTDFDPSYRINKNWKVGGDLGYRLQPSTRDQTAYIRPGISYSPGKIINFTIGVASFNNWNPDMFVSTEFRVFQFMQISWPNLLGIQFKHRLGLEQRLFYLPELGLDKYVNRSRYYLEAISPEFHVFGIISPFFITANFEILRDLNKNELGRLIDHNRFTIGVGSQITDKFKADIRYKMISFIDPDINNFIREVNVIRIRLYYQFASS